MQTPVERLLINKLENNEKIFVKVSTKKQENQLVKHENNVFFVNITKPAIKGKANQELIKFLTKLVKTKLEITSGATSNTKTIQNKYKQNNITTN